MSLIDQLHLWAAERGYKLACGNIGVLDEVRREVEQRKQSGELDAGFHDDQLGFFRYEKSAESIGEAKAVIMAAMPRPAHRLRFELAGGPFEVILPPTYVKYQKVFRDVRDDLVSAVPALHGHLDILLAPLKPLAGRLGLVSYGRNNVTYIADWGSYFQLLGYVTDLQIADLCGSQGPQLMPECENCGICAAACPTGAIGDDRVLLHAELCTTLFSERAGALEQELSANCLFGCLECQEICPVNEGLLRIDPAGVSFDRAETEAILKGHWKQAASANRKLDLLGLTETPLIGRNLAHLIARAGTK